jgi:hypothetical protein
MSSDHDVIVDYKNMIESFLNNNISLQEFILTYLEFFKKEKRLYKDEIYYILDELFGDVDMCTSDNYLLSVHFEFYIDESTLRKKAHDALQKLKAVNVI